MENRPSIYKKILREYEKKSQDLKNNQLDKIEYIYKKIPKIKEIDMEIKNAGIENGLKVLRGEKIDISYIKDLEAYKKSVLIDHGIDPESLEPRYECEICKDTGFVSGEQCVCFRRRLINEYYKMSNIESLLERENFDTFDLNIFSEDIDKGEEVSARENIIEIFNASRRFIEDFDIDNTKNLLFYGTTGLGKTFMINSIARELLDLGYTVVYQTAHSLFETVEDYRFNRNKDDSDIYLKYEYLLKADLLIIDDLGTENINSFTQSELFNIINSRNLSNGKMVISTNLTPIDIKNQYSDRIFSRIADSFNIYRFIGEDLRMRRY